MADEIGAARGPHQQWDIAYNLYHRPANRFVADFVGRGYSAGEVLNPEARNRTGCARRHPQPGW
jgi:iron(III) transport system ATP-binding protein